MDPSHPAPLPVSAPPRAFDGLRGLTAAAIPTEAAAAVTLAAIALPEQVATARLMGLPPAAGLLAFVAGTLAYAFFGRHRTLSVGADSTIAPIMAAGLGGLAVAGSADYALLAAVLAVMTGGLLILTRPLRLGWIADLLSIPVTVGFMAGIAAHIVVGALPALMGIEAPSGPLLARLWALAWAVCMADPAPLAIGLGVAALALGIERLLPRWPGPLIALAVGTLGAWALVRAGHPVAMLDALSFPMPGAGGGALIAALPGWRGVAVLFPLALIVALVVMIQTAAVLQSHEAGRIGPPDPDRDFAAVGLGSVLAGLIGGFAVNASPPRTAVAEEAGARSQWSALMAVALTLGVALVAAQLFAHIPRAGVAGVLIFIGVRLVRLRLLTEFRRRSPVELILALVAAALVIGLPIMLGVGLAVVLSLLHAIYNIARPHCAELGRVPGTTIWWSHPPGSHVEHEKGVLVLSLGAPLNFVNTRYIAARIGVAVARARPHLLVLEASAVVGVDFTGARLLSAQIADLRADGVEVALARLESEPARAAAERTGLLAALGPGRVFFSVEEAVRTLKDA